MREGERNLDRGLFWWNAGKIIGDNVGNVRWWAGHEDRGARVSAAASNWLNRLGQRLGREARHELDDLFGGLRGFALEPVALKGDGGNFALSSETQVPLVGGVARESEDRERDDEED
jgi:hypothetical protein